MARKPDVRVTVQEQAYLIYFGFNLFILFMSTLMVFRGRIDAIEKVRFMIAFQLLWNMPQKKFDSLVKSYINRELNKFIENEKPSEIVYEDLTFVSWQDRYPKHVKRKLSRWIKGYIQQRINYKGDLKNILLTKVNPAYTS